MQTTLVRQRGVTMVELTLILIMAGLLLGTFVKGQEITTSGRAKTLAADQAALQTAFNLYLDRFRVVPGDDATASARFNATQCGLPTGCRNGNGNGAIVGPFTDRVTAAGAAGVTDGPGNEVNKLWQHLRAAGLIRVDGSSYYDNPVSPSGGLIAVAGPTIAGANIPYAGMPPASLYLAISNVPGHVAQALDDARDDGLVNLGYYRAAANPGSAAPGVRYPAGSVAIATPLL